MMMEDSLPINLMVLVKKTSLVSPKVFLSYTCMVKT